MIKQTIPFDEHYYKYKKEADKVRENYKPMEQLEREEWLQLYKEIMEVISSSKDWTEWIWNSRNNQTGGLRNRYAMAEPFIGWLNGEPIPTVWIKKKQASIDLGIPAAAPSQILLGYIIQSKGYTFKYLCDMDDDEIINELEARGQTYDEWKDKISKL